MHAMLPHFPYVTNRNCTVKPVSQWRRRTERRSLNERQEAYYDQLHCSMRYIDRIVAALKESPAGGNAIIIVHGDHGSRIVNADPIAERRGLIENDEMISGFSTLFAVHLPDQKPRNHAGFAAAPNILHSLVKHEFKSAPDLPSETRPSVVLDDMTWKPIRPMDLPTDW
jgi:arylsulfatase A-like enzyme